MASIHRQPNGKWRARWREYPGAPERARHFDRKVDAEQYLTTIRHDLLTGVYVDPAKGRTPLGEYYEVWKARQPWRLSTKASVTSVFSRHVLPVFEARPLSSIRRGDIEDWSAGLDLAPSTAGLAVQYLTTLFESALADGLIGVNPAHRAKRPKVDTAPIVPLTADELDRLRDASPPWFRIALTLGASCGLRQGETTGLTVDRIDFLGARDLLVDRQLVTPAGGDPVFGPLKTAKSHRRIPLADVALEDLAAHLEAHGTGQDGLVLHEAGKPIRRQRFGKLWRGLRDDAGLPEARFHDTRHTFASLLLSGGVSVPATADYLGHSPAMLMSTYAHLMPADHDRARSAVQAAFAQPAADSLRTGGR